LKNLKNLNNKVSKLGGIGPSKVGSPDWNSIVENKKRIKEYSQINRLLNRIIFTKSEQEY